MSTPLRIAVVAACPFPLARGTPVRILRIAEALGRLGHDVHIVTYHLGAPDIPVSVPVHRIRKLSFYSKLGPGPAYTKLLIVDPLLLVRLRALMRERSFDVIHAHHYEGLMIAAAANLGHRLPIIYDAHTLLMSELPYYPLGLPEGFKQRLGRWMDSRIPRLADHTVCVTSTIHDRLVSEAGLSSARVSLVSNGVEYEHFASATRDGPPAADHRCIFTGNLAEYQGIDLMLRAFRIVLEKVPDARLVIASDSQFAPYEALAKELGIAAQIDLVQSPTFDQLPSLLASADVAITPRVGGDGIPVKLLNYMAAARAVVAFAGSAPGVVHGQNGWLAAPGDIDELAAGIVTLLQQKDLAHRLGAAAQQYVQANCRWETAAERCEAVYRRLLQKAA